MRLMHEDYYHDLLYKFTAGHPLSTYAKYSKKLTFLTPWYAHVRKLTFLTPWYAYVRVRIRRLEMLILRKILRTYLMDGLLCESS